MPKNRFPGIAEKGKTAVVMEEDVLDVTDTAKNSYLWSKAVLASRAFLQAIQTEIGVCHNLIQSLNETLELHVGANLAEALIDYYTVIRIM